MILTEIEAILEELRAETGASRVTLRQDRPGDVFPVTHEALAPGVLSVREVRTPNMRRQPVVLQVQQGRQVVQNDCLTAFDDPDFQRMLELYGGMRAQIVTPVMAGGELKAILSLHRLGAPRAWTEHEIQLCAEAAARVGELL